MKLSPLILALFLFGCSAVQVATTAADIANIAGSAYSDYTAALSGTLTPSQLISSATLAYNDLSGLAAVAQGFVGSGKTPAAANIVGGASLPAVAAKVVAALPAQPITQSVVNALYAAAALTKGAAK